MMYPTPETSLGEPNLTEFPSSAQNQSVSSLLVLPQVSMQPMHHQAAEAGTVVSDASMLLNSKDAQADPLNVPIHGDLKSGLDISAGDTQVNVNQFDWSWLCMPRCPWSKDSRLPAFYGIHDKIPLPVALVMGSSTPCL